MARTRHGFATLRTEGGLLPSGVLQRVAARDKSLDALKPEAYHLAEGETFSERIERAWVRARALWQTFSSARAKLGPDDPATSLTREKWLLPLFEELGFGRLQAAAPIATPERSFAISHGWQNLPIHLVAINVDLDTKAQGVPGASRASPHGLMQEALNKSDAHLWGLVSNGRALRILRDHAAMTRQAFVEFDLETMLEGEHFADFALLWLTCHQSRFEGKPEEFVLERWSRAGAELGVRALDHLREGVTAAITSLGAGFLASRGNTGLRAALKSGELDAQEYYRELLRLAYRLIFLFVAEDRELLHPPKAERAACERYDRWYSTGRLREVARSLRGSRHGDQWQLFRYVAQALGRDGMLQLGLPALGGFIWSETACPHLDASELDNASFLDAIRHLAFQREGKVLLPTDWRNLGSEELGSVYESLLELHPRINADAGMFELDVAAGHERKTSGSYYTPSSLIQCLLDSALDPVLEEAAMSKDPAATILGLKVCDPACGSGHFLVAAAHRIARRLARARTGEEEPSPEAYRTALRDVIGHCIHGVDVNPMAVELCKVSLWMEALEPGKPLSFLDHKIRCGNSLLGATPTLLAKGIPDEAFEPIEGDDKAVARDLKKRNKSARKGQGLMFSSTAVETAPFYGTLGTEYGRLDALDDSHVAGVRAKEQRHAEIESALEYRKAKLVADAWCAAFVWRKAMDAPDGVTQDVFEKLTKSPDLITAATIREVQRIANQYQFFHWHLAFPDVFRMGDQQAPENDAVGWSGGFDVVLGNPPWERMKLQEQEWFAARVPEIAKAPNKSARTAMIAQLAKDDPVLHNEFIEGSRRAGGESSFVRNSGRFPLCGRGDVNTYTIFAETMRTVLSRRGRVGCIVPSGIATDDTTKFFFQDLVESGRLVSLFEFENEGFFGAGQGHMLRFCLMTITDVRLFGNVAIKFMFQAGRVEELDDPDRVFELSASEIALINPNTRTCPIFRTRRDAEITKAIYRRVPALIVEGPPESNPWGMSFQRMFDMSNDSGLFRTRDELEREGWNLLGSCFQKDGERLLPLYEAKMLFHFTHRYGDHGDVPHGASSHVLPDVPDVRLADHLYSPLPRYWVRQAEVQSRLGSAWPHPFLLGWRGIADSRASARTVIASLLPRYGTGNSLPLMLVGSNQVELMGALAANLSAFVYDYAARQKVPGNNLNYFIFKQLPVLPPSIYAELRQWCGDTTLAEWLVPRVLELVYTANDMASFARSCGYEGRPFRWDPERRFELRCQLDAAFFHIYGLPRDDVAYIMDTFPIVRRHDERAHGTYRTKTRILELYDEYALQMTSVDAPSRPSGSLG